MLLCCRLFPGYGGGGLSGTRSELVEAVLIILSGDWLVVRDTGEFDPVSSEPSKEIHTSMIHQHSNIYHS